MRRIILLAVCLLASATCDARGYSVNDYLSLQTYGQVLFAPKAGLALVERRRPYRDAPDFAYDNYANTRILSRVLVTSIDHPGALRPLFRQEKDAGYWFGSLSPSGRSITVFRLQRRRLSVGVVNLIHRTVVWLPAIPDLPSAAPSPIWRDEAHVVFVAMPTPRLPPFILTGSASTDALVHLWAAQSKGGLSRTLVTSKAGPQPDNTCRQVIEAPTNGGPTRTLFRGDVVDMSMAPDHRRIAVVVAGASVRPPSGAISSSFEGRRHSLRVLAFDRPQSTEAHGDVLPGFISWSREGNLLYVARAEEGDWSQAYFYTMGIGGRTVRLGGPTDIANVLETGGSLVVHAGWVSNIAAGWVRTPAGQPAWMTLREGRANPIPVGSDALPIGSTADALWLRDGDKLLEVKQAGVFAAAAGLIRTGLIRLDPYSIGYRSALNPEGLPIFDVGVPGHAHTMMIGALGGIVPAVERSSGDDLLAVEGHVAITRSVRTNGEESLLFSRSNIPDVLIDRINTRLEGIDLPRTVRVTTRSETGELLNHWLLLPTRGRGPWPTVVNPYPGAVFSVAAPRQARVSWLDVAENAPLLTSRGYAVLLPSMPLGGTPGHQSDRFAGQIDQAIAAAAASGRVDLDRIAVLGQSFGGYAAMTLATQTSRFKAIIAANGPVDLISGHGSMAGADKVMMNYGVPFQTAQGWAENGQAGVGGTIARNEEAYLAASPILRMDQVVTPLLLITGDLDFVSSAQSEQAFMELARYGKEVTLARYWGEGHTNSSPANIADYWNLVLGFLDAKMAPKATPDQVPPRLSSTDVTKPSITRRSRPAAKPRSSHK